jgi:hypothetical protein
MSVLDAGFHLSSKHQSAGQKRGLRNGTTFCDELVREKGKAEIEMHDYA